MKKIAIFTAYFPPHLGGIENYTYNIAKLLAKNYDVTIITSLHDNNLKMEEKVEGFKIFRLPIKNLFKSRYPLHKKNTDFKKIIEKIENKKFDFIILNTRFFLNSHLGAKFAYKNKIPTILIDHGCAHLTINNKILDLFGSYYEHFITFRIKKYVKNFYGISSASNEWLKHFKIDSKGTLNGAVDIELKKKFKKNLDDKRIIISYAGRLLKQKGLIELLESFNTLSKKYDNIYLHIAGKGNLEEYIKENYLKNNNRIKMLGYLKKEDLMTLYSKTNIFVYAPNHPEGLGLSVIEAGLMKCAVIVSNQKGITEVVPNENFGLIANNKEDILKHLNELILDRNLREKLAINLEKRVLDNFSWEKTTAKIINIIENKVHE